MKQSIFSLTLIAFCIGGLISCTGERKHEKTTQPEVFVPATEPATRPDSVPKEEVKMPEAPIVHKKPPTIAELKTITPSQEAKRALSNDAMKATSMPLDKFGEYMQSRIPYYRGKGELKVENDIVRIEITKTEMHIQTPKGSLTYPMQ